MFDKIDEQLDEAERMIDAASDRSRSILARWPHMFDVPPDPILEAEIISDEG
jgi:hypothetical protein